jgi:hypothetical protein
MPQPVAFNTGSSISGSIQASRISYAIETSGSNYRSGYAGKSWYSELPANNGIVFIKDTTSIGRGAPGNPAFWISNGTSSASILATVNGLPGSPRNFTTTSSAYSWSLANGFFINDPNEPFNQIDTDNLALYLDASKTVSYPTTASTWYDISGNNNSGSLFNGPTFNSIGYINFDGVDDYNLVPNNPSLQPPTSLTLECLLKPNAIVGGSWMIAYTGAANGSFVKYGFRVAGISQFSGYINSNGSIAQTFGNTLVTGSWIHGILTYNGTSAILYCNGVLVATTAITGSMDYNAYGSPYFLTMGRKSAIDGQYFNGSISSARVYSYAFSQSQVSQNYYQAPIVTNGLIFSVDAGNLVSYESSSVRAYSLSLSGSRTTPVSCSLTNGLAFYTNNGGYFDFDGTDDQLLIENVPAQSTGIHLGNGTIPWMVNAWVKTSTSGNNNIGSSPILSNRSGGPVYSNMGIGAGGVMKYAHYSGSWIIETGSIAVNNNQWHMLSWVNLNNNTMNLYVDGIFDKNVSSSIVGGGNINPVDIIGASFGGFLNGDIAFLSINISSSLYTIQNVQQNFNAQRNRFNI